MNSDVVMTHAHVRSDGATLMLLLGEPSGGREGKEGSKMIRENTYH